MPNRPGLPASVRCVFLLAALFLAPLSAAGQSLDAFVLVNAASNSDVQTLADGDVLQLDDFSTSDFSVRAVAGGSVESVRFSFAGDANYQTENSAPYALNGDSNGNYDPVPELSQPGSYTLRATPYAGSGVREITFSTESGTSPPEGCTAEGAAGSEVSILR